MLLRLDGVETAYDTSKVLFGVDLEIAEGEAVALLGRNGMGKTTTVRSIMGLTPPHAGRVEFDGRDVTGRAAFRIARAGIGLVPEGRQIFPNLTVRENLQAAARGEGWTLESVYTLFPRLAERADHGGNALSGGEQQMLAIGRALMTNPRLLILDEATEGLAPVVRRDIWRCLERLRGLGQSLLIIDRNIDALLELCDRHYIIHKGAVAWQGTSGALRAEPELRRRYLGV
ncbi:branched-chain amino acid transport system ATP-binding protein [Natronocella acetinitrilica]|jgi:branched-chain amino acid transport system ATP-binding protein|uniref:Branched-chain amino acid transport system ATP-binding protein n=1 Tax=Natronocella acetinitrilica TaxID=414046 RepID=A0AAE3G532_9GAMM|nr:ABC transporter ATP-binding protein [Natronocella acetinitrilica]MCP1675293.1 branched-chain amino acid transport system ATP-binding protein [Natronocella acetinitrilica]